MIVVRVELHSARTHRATELARMEIYNDETGTPPRRNYRARVFRGRCAAQLDKREVHKRGELKAWPSQRRHVWNMVAAMLASIGYGAEAAR